MRTGKWCWKKIQYASASQYFRTSSSSRHLIQYSVSTIIAKTKPYKFKHNDVHYNSLNGARNDDGKLVF